MEPLQKLTISAEAARWEADGEGRRMGSVSTACGQTPAQLRRRYGAEAESLQIRVDGHELPIHLAVMPGGRRLPLLKAMLTTACEQGCLYCPFQAGRDYPRVTFRPDELARLYMRGHSAGVLDGLFLSTGIFSGGANTQSRLIETAEILREKLGYHGYLHLKIMPGAEQGQVRRAMELADRVSVNLESPNATRLLALAPQKQFDSELLTPLRWVAEIRRLSPPPIGRKRWPSSTTQFVVGATDETDLELLSTVNGLYGLLGLQRTYFEAFNPIPGTPLADLPETDHTRQHRLYQASFLLRDYSFDLEDIQFTGDGMLSLETDPKTLYAEKHLKDSPIELNKAAREELLRVPGIGPRSAQRILASRRTNSLRSLQHLQRLGILAARAAPYITLNGSQVPQQLELISSSPTTDTPTHGE